MKFLDKYYPFVPKQAAPRGGDSFVTSEETQGETDADTTTFEDARVSLSVNQFGEDGTSANRLLTEETVIEGGLTDKERIKSIKLARKYAVMDPLCSQTIDLYDTHALGSGVSVQITSKDKSDKIAKKAQSLIDDFVADPTNAKHISPIGQRKNSSRFLTDGNWFVALHDMGTDGIRIRNLDTLQIAGRITNPLDGDEIWFHIRRIQHVGSSKTETLLYKDISIRNQTVESLRVPDVDDKKEIVRDEKGKVLKRAFDIERDVTGDNVRIVENVVVIHGAINSTGPMGNSILVAGYAYAREYRSFVEDRGVLRRAKSQYAFKEKIDGGKDVLDAQRAMLKSSLSATNSRETNPPSTVASRHLENMASTLTPMDNSTQAQDAKIDGNILLKLFANAVKIPPQYFGEESARLATQTSIEGPVLKVFKNYQNVLASIYIEIFSYVLEKGGINLDTVEIDLDFPPIKEKEKPEQIEMLEKVTAMFPEFLESNEVKELALATVGFNNPKQIVDDTKDKRPEPVAPPAPPEEQEPMTAADQRTRLLVGLSRGLHGLAMAEDAEIEERKVQHA